MLSTFDNIHVYIGEFVAKTASLESYRNYHPKEFKMGDL
jgi:hypothetical protein